MSEEKSMGIGSSLMVFVIAFTVVAALFYGLDHFVMYCRVYL